MIELCVMLIVWGLMAALGAIAPAAATAFLGYAIAVTVIASIRVVVQIIAVVFNIMRDDR